MAIRVFLSYDYELYFNDMYESEETILIDTTDMIKNALEIAGVTATFFVDTECLFAYERVGNIEFVDKVKKQLQELYKSGFDIQLHLHPLWRTAKRVDGKWVFDYTTYGIGSINEDIARQMLIEGKRFLEDVLGDTDSGYRCIAFRAGGFCLPDTSRFYQMLVENGFKYDSSICSNNKLVSRYQTYDYTKRRFSKRGPFVLFADKGNEIIEIPIITFRRFSLGYISRKNKMVACTLRGKSSPIEKVGSLWNGIQRRLEEIFKESALLSLDSTGYELLLYALKKRYNGGELVSILGHPKIQNICTVENTLKLIESLKEEKADFLKFGNLVLEEKK